jgi:hypothetical protein
MKVDFVRVFMMTSWPGTLLNDRLKMEGRLIGDWDRTRKDIPNIHYKNHTHDELIAARKEVMDSFFNPFNVVRIIIRWLFIDRTLIMLFLRMFLRNRVSERIRNQRALKFSIHDEEKVSLAVMEEKEA